MNRHLLPLAAVVILSAGCDRAAVPLKTSQVDLLNTYLSTNAPNLRSAELNGVVHVTENGCMACNRAFATLVGEHANDSTLLFIVSAIGQQVDVTAFKEAGARVIWDYDEEFKKTGLLDKSGFIGLDHGRIDTILLMEPLIVEAQLAYVAVRLADKSARVP